MSTVPAPETMKPTKIVFLKRLSFALALCGAILLCGLIVREKFKEPVASQIQTLTPLEGIGGSFNLTNQHGARISEKIFLGKPTLYFFGFTHCPDICPTTLYELTNHLKGLGGDAEKLNAVFVTVDPERDTQKVLADYMSAFDPRIIALTGSRAEIDAMLKAYRVYAKKVPLEGSAYTMDHTASVYAADKDGRVVMLIDFHKSPEMVKAKIQRLLKMS